MLTDSIKLRKIRYDVLEYLENLDLNEKIEKYITDDKKTIDEGQELLKLAGLQPYLNTIEEITDTLSEYLVSFDNVESVTHSPLLDYIMDIQDCLSDNEFTEEKFLEKEDALYNFAFQMMQIYTLKTKLVESFVNTVYIGKDKGLYSTIDDSKILDYADIIGADKVKSEDYSKYALQFFIDSMISNQRKLILTLDYDEEGFYVSPTGEQYFEEDDKNYIVDTATKWLDIVYGNESEDDRMDDESGADNEVILDDVAIDDSKNKSPEDSKLSNESDERIQKLQKSLKDSTNIIRKK